MTSNRLSVAAAAVAVAMGCSAEQNQASLARSTSELRSTVAPTVTPQESGTAFRFFAVSPVNAKVVWASAAGGTFALTTDGGKTWNSRQVSGAETLQFRDVEGVSENVAYLMSAGTGEANRIYKTQDGGNHWTLQAQAGPDPRNFWDCFAFWTPTRAILMVDSIDDRFPLRHTTDGRHWPFVEDPPRAQPGEGAFAASGTCAATQGESNAWLATGAAAVARVLRSRDGGKTWRSSATPIQPQGTPVSGNVSVDFRDARRGVVGGGDVVASTVPQHNVARSRDGGETWTLTTPTPFTGAVYGLTYTRNHHEDDDDEGDNEDDNGDSALRRVVATGPGGSAWTENEGNTWTLLPGITNCWAVGFANQRTGWLVCGAGRIWRIDF